MERWNVGILLFDDVEVLDFAGPFEVFSRTRLAPGPEARRSEESAPFRVFTVARSAAPVTATGGLRVLPGHGFADAPPIDLLVVPGGFGTRGLLAASAPPAPAALAPPWASPAHETLGWIERTARAARRVTSVCTGSLLLARAGLLRGRRATTHWAALDLLGQVGGEVTVVADQRVVDDGVITSAGVAAGIDMAFHVVAALHGRAVAAETARYIDYPWTG